MSYLLIGLGNPGAQYAPTRHNAGFWLVEAVRLAHGWPAWKSQLGGLVSKGKVPLREGSEDIVLLQPQTFMNLSGPCVQAVGAFYKIAPAQWLVAHDELDVPAGDIRWKMGGGTAGHNGLKSIQQATGTADFARLRLGIGRPVHKSAVADYVLEPFSPSEALQMAENVAWLAGKLPELLTEPAKTLAARPKAT